MKFNDMVKLGYFLHMAEAEGMDSLVDTRTAKLNAVRKELSYDPSFEEVEQLCLSHGITSVSPDEFQYITRGKI